MAMIPADKVQSRMVNITETLTTIKYQRLIGKVANKQEKHFSNIMKVIGKNLSDLRSDPDLLSLLTLDRITKLLHVDIPIFGKEYQFTPTHILAMLLSDFKAMAEAAVDMDAIVDEFCIGIPGYFTKSQQIAVLQAADIAGLNVSVFSATTAIALMHAVRGGGSDQEQKVAFVDVTDSAMQVCIVVLEKRAKPDPKQSQTAAPRPQAKRILEVLSYSYDLLLSQKDFLNTLVKYFKENGQSTANLQEDCLNLMIQNKQVRLKKQRNNDEELGQLMFRSEKITEAEFKCICNPFVQRMKGLLQKAIDKDNRKFSAVFITGPGSHISPIYDCVQEVFNMTPGVLTGTTYEGLSVGVAVGCAQNCAIQSKKFLACSSEDERSKYNMKKLLEWQVKDKWALSIKDERTEVSIAGTVDGRVELMTQEINDAHLKECKMLLPKTIEDMISHMKKLPDFLNIQESSMLGNLSFFKLLDEQVTKYLKDVLDGGGLDAYETYVRIFSNDIEPVIKCFIERKNGHDTKQRKIDKLKTMFKAYTKFVSPDVILYSAIPQPAKTKFNEQCDMVRQRFNSTNAVHQKKKSKAYVPDEFNAELDSMIEELNDAYKETLAKWKPKKVKLYYNILQDDYPGTITKIRETLLHPEKKKILGCRLLPLQLEHQGVPHTWLHLYLQGEKDDAVMLHVKKHNGYIIGFDNKERQSFELTMGIQDDELAPPKIPRAKYVGFGYDYISLLKKEMGSETTDILKFVCQFVLDVTNFLNSIHVLSYFGCDLNHRQACPLCSSPRAAQRAIVCISFMLFEPSRIKEIENAIYNGGFLGQALTEVLMQAIWHWKEMSDVLLRYDRPEQKTEIEFIDAIKIKVNLHTVQAIAKFLSLILNRKANDTDKVEKKQDDSDEDGEHPDDEGEHPDDEGEHPDEYPAGDGDDNQFPPPSPAAPGDGDDKEKQLKEPPMEGRQHGQTLLHIFDVRFTGHKKDLRGIVVHEGRGSHVINSLKYVVGYWRSSNDLGRQMQLAAHYVHKQSLSLSGPSVAISPEDGCSLEFFPKRWNKSVAGDDLALKKKDTVVMRLDDGRSYYNQQRLKEISLGSNSLLVSYAIFTGAVEATMEISLRLPREILCAHVLNLNICGFIEVQLTSQDTTILQVHAHPKHGIVSRDPIDGKPVLLSKHSALSPGTGGYVSMPKHPGLLDLVHSTTISVPLVRPVMVVKLDSEIKFSGTLAIQDVGCMDIDGNLCIPREVDVSRNVKTRWKSGLFGIDYQVKMNLVNRFLV
ncbi:hypothetical protein VPH35_110705 [Triticum aestivum]|uniref:uncharacterized protein n=1 Tax=Triticum aestivum TaxID=4565 RepID=UPI001D00CF90|nr:uncharacterized protein LOC123136963 [Triticum aestivum]XP_044412425.1 uncharacterized protein LOC123136963 [Triticum aestivum]